MAVVPMDGSEKETVWPSSSMSAWTATIPEPSRQVSKATALSPASPRASNSNTSSTEPEPPSAATNWAEAVARGDLSDFLTSLPSIV